MLSAAPTPQHHAQRRIVLAKLQSYEVNAQAFHSCAFFNRFARFLGLPNRGALLFFCEKKSRQKKTTHTYPSSQNQKYRAKENGTILLSHFQKSRGDSRIARFYFVFRAILESPLRDQAMLVKKHFVFYFTLGKKNIPPTSLRGSLESEIIFFSCALQNSAMRSASGWEDMSPVKYTVSPNTPDAPPINP